MPDQLLLRTLDHPFQKSNKKAGRRHLVTNPHETLLRMKYSSLLVLTALLLLCTTSRANPGWNGGGCGWNGGGQYYRGGGCGWNGGGQYYRGGGCGWNGGGGYYGGAGGWCGAGIPNGLGWALYGIQAVSSIVNPPVYVAPQPVYVAPAPVYIPPQPVICYPR